MKSLPLRDDEEIVTLNICDMRETRELCGLGGVEGEGRSGCI